MFSQLNPEIESNEKTQCEAFKAVYKAGKEQDPEAIKKILDEHKSLNIFEDGTSYQGIWHDCGLGSQKAVDHRKNRINKITPLALLAYEGDEKAVNFLLSHGAYPPFAAYGYARNGHIKQVDELIDRCDSVMNKYEHFALHLKTASIAAINVYKSMGGMPSGLRLLKITNSENKKGENTSTLLQRQVMTFAIYGYNERGCFNSQDNLLSLLTYSEYRHFIYAKVKKYELFEYLSYNLLATAYKLNQFIKKHDLSFKEALVWITSPHLYFWLRDSVALVEQGKLPFQAILIIASYLSPSLSPIEIHNLYYKMTLDAYRISLLNELKDHLLDQATALSHACEIIQSEKELYHLLQEAQKGATEKKSAGFSSLGLFNIKAIKAKALQLVSDKSEDDYADIVDKHLTRLQSRLSHF